MDANTLSHVFEPFFTSKPEGKGTGLGLATVYGIVKQNKGFINIYSEVGRGTQLTIYFPRFRGDTVPASVSPAAESEVGTETVLLVEDNDQLRRLTRRSLERLGYTVLEAASATDALAVSLEHRGDIQLLLTDVVMPGTDGAALSTNLTAVRHGLRTLFMSGYTANVLLDRGALGDKFHYLQKPFDLVGLGKAVRQALGS
jgi:CheY-like chemotaxis protein